MNKNKLKYVVDSLLFICVVGIAFIGILLGFVIPEGPSGSESSKYFLNLHRHQWGNIHLYLSIAFVVLIIIHLILSWKWIKVQAVKIFKKGWKAALLLTVCVAVLVIFLAWIFYPKEPGAYRDYGRGSGRKGLHLQKNIGQISYNQNEVIVTGKMTMEDLEKATGLSMNRIIEVLGLPSNISGNETLGRLGKEYGFSLVELRNILTQLQKRREEPPVQETQIQDVSQEERDKTPTVRGREEKSGEEDKPVRGRMSEDQSGLLITGQMNFYEVERLSGVPAGKIIEKLDLPRNIPLGESLGRLKRRYGFTIQEVRDIVASLMKKY